jgi:hypothetical protein
MDIKNDIGKRAYIGDVWYEILDIRHGINEMSGHDGIEYFVSSKDYWIPEMWVKKIKTKDELR